MPTGSTPAAPLSHRASALFASPPPSPQVHSIGDWWEARPDSPFMCMAERALQKEWGVQPLLVREGERAGMN